MGRKIREPSTFASVLLSLTMLCSGLLLLSPGTRAERLKATNTYHRPVMEARSPKRRCRGGGHAPSGPWGGTCPASSSPLGVAGILSRGVWPLPPSPQDHPHRLPSGSELPPSEGHQPPWVGAALSPSPSPDHPQGSLSNQGHIHRAQGLPPVSGREHNLNHNMLQKSSA